jgi:rod shape-determining protein MreC
MESNRDDFVIAIRSAFLQKGNKQRFSLIGLIVFSIIFLTLGRLNFTVIDYVKSTLKETIYRSSFIISAPENYIKNSYIKIKDHFDSYENYLNIKSELKELKSKYLIDNSIILENKRLKEVIDDFMVDSEEKFAKVIIDKKSPFLRSIVINKGSKNNIKLGMAVLDKNYLVGKVIEVNFLTSRVLLLSDLNSKIPVIIEPGGYLSILSGTGKDDGIIQYLKKDNQLISESLIYTSGAGGIFKSGIPVGKIETSTTMNKNNVRFFSDFTQLQFVKILSFKKLTN